MYSKNSSVGYYSSMKIKKKYEMKIMASKYLNSLILICTCNGLGSDRGSSKKRGSVWVGFGSDILFQTISSSFHFGQII